MKLFDKHIILKFFPILFVSLLFFVLIIQIISLLNDLTQYLQNSIAFNTIARVQLYYLPQSITFSLPIAVLFACSFSLGSTYSTNEIIAILGAGVSLFRFILSLLIIGMVMSVTLFLMEEFLVIENLRKHTVLRREILAINFTYNNAQVAAFERGGRRVYYGDFYDDAIQTLREVIILDRDESGRVIHRVDARTAEWNGEFWELTDVVSYRWDEEERLIDESFKQVDAPDLTLNPDAFRRSDKDIGELRIADAIAHIQNLRETGLPYRVELSNLHRRYAFALTPFVVALLASVSAGRFRKNILLMSLLFSLCLSVGYYVLGLITNVMASTGRLNPIVAAWAGFVIFVILAIFQLKNSRT